MSKRYEPHFGGDPRSLCTPGGEKTIWSDGEVPADTVSGYRKSCIHQRRATVGVFVNDGTETSADFNRVATTTDDVALAATAAEINRVADASARIVTSTATILALTVTEHAERIVLISSNSTVANTFTLPVASGSGAKFTLINAIAQTQGTVVWAANGTDVMTGICMALDSTAAADAMSFLTSATSDKVTLNLTTTGGLKGDQIEAWDISANTWYVRVVINGSGSLATPFAAT